jgi:hypothetical protein
MVTRSPYRAVYPSAGAAGGVTGSALVAGYYGCALPIVVTRFTHIPCAAQTRYLFRRCIPVSRIVFKQAIREGQPCWIETRWEH